MYEPKQTTVIHEIEPLQLPCHYTALLLANISAIERGKKKIPLYDMIVRYLAVLYEC
jgi:hypothetical protein